MITDLAQNISTSTDEKKGMVVKYTGGDGQLHTQRVFDNAMQTIFQQGENNGMAVAIVIDKTDYKGQPSQYWNIKGAELAGVKLETQVSTQEAHVEATPAPRPTQDPTRTSIERQTALKCATEIANAHLAQGSDFSSDAIVEVAKVFETYLSR